MIITPQSSNRLKLKNDIAFKAFFSQKENEVFLKDFLEAILGEKLRIKKVSHDVRLEQLTREQKYGILDLGVELENGKFVNIEIQLQNFNNIEERTTFYASKKITEQLGNGINYEALQPVIIIAILDYNFINLPEYLTETVRVSTIHKDYKINNNVKYYYIELKKFRNQNPDMNEPLNQWLAFLDMERGDLLDMAKKKNEKIKKAYENYETLVGDEEVKRLAEIRLMSELEEQSALATARAIGKERGEKIGREQGEKIGREQGEKIGREQGKKIGREQGEKIGRDAKTKEIVQKLLKKKMPLEEISEISGLTIEEIQSLEKEIQS